LAHKVPDKRGYYGNYGGRFVPETLSSALDDLEARYAKIKNNGKFKAELDCLLKDYAGRPTPLYLSPYLSKITGAKVYLKREDLLHTGAHKINNTLGQGLLALMTGKKRVIAETGAGQHGVATATVAAMMGMKCEIYMGSEDIKRQSFNVFRMEMLGAKVRPVNSGTMTLKDAMNEAIRDWVTNVSDTYYLIGSTAGPHPYPMMVRDFQSVLGREALRDIIKKEGRLPNYLVACVGGGSNAMGLFYPFMGKKVKMIGVEAGGRGINTDMHAATLTKGSPGILHGSLSYVLMDRNRQIQTTHSVSAGLDYPGVGPEHSYLKDSGLAEYDTINDIEAVAAFEALTQNEGIIPALESSHAVAWVMKNKKKFRKNDIIIVNLSGRGDKDLNIIAGFKGVTL